MLFFHKSKLECTGCGACKAACPNNAIVFKEDSEGFLYPIADSSKCTNCGACYNACPTFNISKKPNFDIFAVAATHKNYDTWFNSTSGGAFSGICETFSTEKVSIFGASFEGFQVVHTSAESINEVDKFRRSKYVQSDTRNIFVSVKKLLSDNRKVIFSGTPCQVAGLKNYLGSDNEKLYTIDLICHGVGSPKVFREYIKCLGNKHDSKVLSYTFRSKQARKDGYVSTIEFENGHIHHEFDLYNKGFLQALFLRPSCAECRYANMNRVGDLTIGDLKKQHDLLPNYKGKANLSTIIVNSPKGSVIIKDLSAYMDLYDLDLDKLIQTNNPLRKSSVFSNNRELFFEELSTGQNLIDILNKYIVSPGLLVKMWLLIPEKGRVKIRRALNWIKR